MPHYLIALLAVACSFMTCAPGLAAGAAENEIQLRDSAGQAVHWDGNTVYFQERELAPPSFKASLPDGVSSILGCSLLEKRGGELRALTSGISIEGAVVTINAGKIDNSLRVSRNLCWANGQLYVAEENSSRSTLGCVSVIGGDGLIARRYSTVAHPSALAVSEHCLWVAGDSELAALQLPDGKELFRIALPRLANITQITALGNLLLAGDRGAPAVRAFNATTGIEQAVLIGADQLTMRADFSGIGVAVTKTGRLLVSDSSSVREYSVENHQAKLLRKIVDIPGSCSLAVDGDGNIAVAIPASQYHDSPPTPEVWKFDAQGKPLARLVRVYMRGPSDFDGKQPDSLYKLRVFGGLPGGLRSPGGVAFDNDGRLYVSDSLRWPRGEGQYYTDSNQMQMDGGVVRFSSQSELEARLGSRYSDGEIIRARLAARAKRAPFLRTASAVQAGRLMMLAWGDSITQCSGDWNGGASSEARNWGHVLARTLEGLHPGLKVSEVLDGVGGQNVAESLCRGPGVRATSNVNFDLVLVELGTNDQVFRLTTPAQFADSLRKMLTELVVMTDSDIVLVSPGPLPASIVLTISPPAEYLRAMKAVGAEFHVPVVDMTTGINDFIAKNGKTFADLHLGPENCHPNDAGHNEWAHIVANAVEFGLDKTLHK